MKRLEKILMDGFTLIELLVVITIIAVLASMLLSAISIVRNQARLLRCTSNLRQCSMAVICYAQEQEGMPYSCGNSLILTNNCTWPSLTNPYLDDTYKKNIYTGNNPYHCPFAESEIPNRWQFVDRFSFHFSINTNIYVTYDAINDVWSHLPWALSQVNNNTVMLVDGMVGKTGPTLNYFWEQANPINYRPWPLQGSTILPIPAADPTNPPIVLHRGRVNTSHMDGHVDSVIGVWSNTLQTPAWAR